MLEKLNQPYPKKEAGFHPKNKNQLKEKNYAY